MLPCKFDVNHMRESEASLCVAVRSRRETSGSWQPKSTNVGFQLGDVRGGSTQADIFNFQAVPIQSRLPGTWACPSSALVVGALGCRLSVQDHRGDSPIRGRGFRHYIVNFLPKKCPTHTRGMRGTDDAIGPIIERVFTDRKLLTAGGHPRRASSSGQSIAGSARVPSDLLGCSAYRHRRYRRFDASRSPGLHRASAPRRYAGTVRLRTLRSVTER
jgi:hypothetical protein